MSTNIYSRGKRASERRGNALTLEITQFGARRFENYFKKSEHTYDHCILEIDLSLRNERLKSDEITFN